MTRAALIFLFAFLPAALAAQDIVRADQFLLTTGPCTLRSGSGSPGAGLGATCDVYLDTATGTLWYRTTAGWTAAMSFDVQTANTVFAGPASGGAALPAFRATVKADLPAAVAYEDEANIFTAAQTVSASSGSAVLKATVSTNSWPELLLERTGASFPAAWDIGIWSSSTALGFWSNGADRMSLGTDGILTVTGLLNANGGIAVDTSAFTVADSTGNTGIAGYVGHPSYASQISNWRITAEGAADFRYLFTDEMHAKSFIADLEQALAGGQIIAKSVAMVSQTFTCPPSSSSTLWVRDLPSAANMAAFEAGDWVVLRTFSRAAGSLTIADCVGQVTNYADGTGANDGQQSWTFTRGEGGSAGTMAGETQVAVDSLVIDYGISGNGYYEVNAIDGAYSANSPYAQVVTWATAPVAANRTVRARFGQLTGVTGTSEYGLIAGSYAASNGSFFRASEDNFDLHGITARWWDSATNVVTIAPSSGSPYLGIGNPAPSAYGNNAGIYLGWETSNDKAKASFYSDANNYWQFDGAKLTWKAANTTLDASGNLTATSATLSGSITASSGAIGGWTVGATALTAGSGATTVGLDAGGTNPAIYAGSATPASAPFRVLNDGTVTATKLTSGYGRNLWRNSECKVGTADYSTYTNSGLTIGFGADLSPWALFPRPSTCYATVSGGTPGAGTILDVYLDTKFAVVAGLKYEASAYVGTHRATSSRIWVKWEQSNGTHISYSSGSVCAPAGGVGGPTLSTYCRTALIATAPALAALGRLQLQMTHNGTEDNPYMFFVRGYFGEAGVSQTEFTPWGPAGLTEIVGGLIKTGTIVADNIATNAITADKIFAGAVTAGKISVDTLAAIKADLGAVTAGSIVVGTTDKLWLNESADGQLAIGGSTKASAPFRVSAAGALTATSASISGAIDATSGSLGGLTIDGTLTFDGSNGLIEHSHFTLGNGGLLFDAASGGSDYASMVRWSDGSFIAGRNDISALHLQGPSTPQINLYASSLGLWASTYGVILNASELYPEQHNYTSLGTSSNKWSDVWVYGTVYAGTKVQVASYAGATNAAFGSCADGIYSLNVQGGIVTGSPTCVDPATSLRAQVEALREEVLRLRALMEGGIR